MLLFMRTIFKSSVLFYGFIALKWVILIKIKGGRSEACDNSKEVFHILYIYLLKTTQRLRCTIQAILYSIGRKMPVIGLFRSHLHPLTAFKDIGHLFLLESLHLPCWHFIFFSLSFVWYASCLHALFSILFFFLIQEKYPCPLPVLSVLMRLRQFLLLFVLNS